MPKLYKPEEIDRGLMELCIHGDAKGAAQALKRDGITIAERTLQDWRHSRAERLAEIEQQVVAPTRERLARLSEQRAIQQDEVERVLTEQLLRLRHALKPGELAGAVRNISTAKAINVDKSSLLRGMPTEIRETRNADEILKRWQAAGLITNGTAEEITEDPQSLPAG